MRLKIIKLCFFVFASVFILKGQVGPPEGKFEMNSRIDQIILPFEMVNNHIIITGIVNGIKVKLVLDTGFIGHGVFLYKNEKISNSGIKPTSQIMVQGAGGAKPAGIVLNGKVNFDGFRLSGLYIIIMSQSDEMKKRFHADGIIGYSIFSRFVVDINFKKKKLILIRPEKFKYRGTGKRLPLNLNGGIFVECSVSVKTGTSEKLNCFLDTGATHTLMLFTDDRKKLPEVKSFTRKAAGASETFNYQVFRGHQLTFAGSILKKPILFSADKEDFGLATRGSDANLGMGLLKKFHLIFDYSRKELILEPNENFSSPFEYNMSGIFFFRNPEKKIIVFRILKGSPAQKAGILPGDIIISINGKRTETFTEDQIYDSWKINGSKVGMKIKRGNKIKKILFTTKRLL